MQYEIQSMIILGGGASASYEDYVISTTHSPPLGHAHSEQVVEVTGLVSGSDYRVDILYYSNTDSYSQSYYASTASTAGILYFFNGCSTVGATVDTQAPTVTHDDATLRFICNHGAHNLFVMQSHNDTVYFNLSTETRYLCFFLGFYQNFTQFSFNIEPYTNWPTLTSWTQANQAYENVSIQVMIYNQYTNTQLTGWLNANQLMGSHTDDVLQNHVPVLTATDSNNSRKTVSLMGHTFTGSIIFRIGLPINFAFSQINAYIE